MYEYKKGFAISVKVPESLYDAVTLACQQAGKKRSELVRDALEAEVRRIGLAHGNIVEQLAVEFSSARTLAPSTRLKRDRLARQIARELARERQVTRGR